MPVKKSSKKKKTVKKKSQKSIKDDGEDIKHDNMEPGSLVSGTKTDPLLANGGKKKKKLKKKKMTKSEKDLEKLEKAAEKIKEDDVYLQYLINKINQWLSSISTRAVAIFKQIDISGDGVLTYEEFKSGMFDLNVPLNKTELHLFTKLLDKDESGEIDYTEFSKGIAYIKPEEEPLSSEKDEIKLILSERKPAPLKLGSWQPFREKNPKYLLIELRMVTFDNFKEHPGHITVLVHVHLSIYGLIEILIQQTSVLSTKLAIFTNKSRETDALLPVESTLEDCGYKGGTRQNPEEVTLYYDYTVEFTECPILMCDHYFGQKEDAEI